MNPKASRQMPSPAGGWETQTAYEHLKEEFTVEAPSLPHPWPQAPTQGRKGVPLFCEPFPGAQAQIPCGHCSWAHLGHGARGQGQPQTLGSLGLSPHAYGPWGQFTWGA